MTRFFIPGNTPEQSEDVYAYVVKYVKAMLDCEIDPVRICAFDYTHEGQEVTAAVGEIEPGTGQLVIAILRSDAYLICTPYYGVQRGEPIQVELAKVTGVRYFEGLDNARENLRLAVSTLDAGEGSERARIRAVAAGLELVTIADFPTGLVPDFLSLKHKLSWRGNLADTIDQMSDAEASDAAAAIRDLYRRVL